MTKFNPENTSLELLTETFSFNDNIHMQQSIDGYDIKPLPEMMIGDKVKIKSNTLEYYNSNNTDWLDNNHIGYSWESEEYITYCLRNNTELEVLSKSKGQSDEEFPWWSSVENVLPNRTIMNTLFIPDMFLEKNIKVPSYSPKKFIRESVTPLKYMNEITNEITPWKYRFKTKKEFEKEFGNGEPLSWRKNVELDWVYDMDYLFGETLRGVPDFASSVVYAIGMYSISKGMITPNKLVGPTYQPKQFIRESADSITIDGYDANNWSEDSKPFVASKYNQVEVGDYATKHTEMYIDDAINSFRDDYFISKEKYEEKMGRKPSDPITIQEIEEYYEGQADFKGYFEDIFELELYDRVDGWDYIGRIWDKLKLISFWKYPENKEELKKLITELEKVTKLKIWDNGWKIEVLDVLNVNDTSNLIYDRDDGVIDNDDDGEGYMSRDKLIPLESYEKSLNPSEKVYMNHMKSPLEKPKSNVKGFGSDKKLPNSLPGELPIETRNRLYQEAMVEDFVFDGYLKKEKELNFNTIIINIEENPNQIENEKLIEILHSLKFARVDSSFQIVLDENHSDKALIIILHNLSDDYAGLNRLDKARLYTCNLEYINNGDFTSQYSYLIWDGYSKVSDTINLFNDLMTIKPTYEPKKFIRESIKKLKDFE